MGQNVLLSQCISGTRVKKCNTFLDVQERMPCLAIDKIIVTSTLDTLTKCVTKRHTNTFIDI